jgi:hypothetical protein
MLRIISLGAGVQSTTMALMAAAGEIGPMPDAAIFADVGDEPAPVYEHLRWLASGNVLPFPVKIVGDRGQLSKRVLAGDKAARPPFFVRTKKGVGMLARQCTRNFKVRPIRAETRRLLGVGPRSYVAPGAVEAWIGISVDEIIRARRSGCAYIVNRHPLIEKGMTRRECKKWLVDHGYSIPPKSSCWHCPYQSDEQWREKRDNRPDEFALAVAFDVAIRSPAMVKLYGAEGFVHSSGRPLSEVDLDDPNRDQLNLFINECEGTCGV